MAAINRDKIKKTRKEIQGGGDFWKPKEGKSFVHLLPPAGDLEEPWVKVYIHYNVGEDNRVFVCPKKNFNKPCPICREVKKLFNGSEDDKELAKTITAKRQFYSNIIDLENPDEGVQVWRYGISVLNQLLDCFEDDENPDDIIDYTHPKKGRKLIIVRHQKSKNSDFIEYNIRLGKPHSIENWEKLSKDLPDITQYLK